VFPLSPFQQIVWLQQHLASDGRAYHATIAIDFAGKVDSAALRTCIEDAVGRHDAMRIRMCDDGSPLASQEVVDELAITVPEHDLRGLAAPEDRRSELLHQHVNAEFDLSSPPLARWTLVHVADDHWTLFVTEHHLVHDGRSMMAFLRDVLRQYSAKATGQRYEFSSVPTYEQYVAHTASSEYRAIVDADVAWWTHQLDGAEFIIDFPRLAAQRSGMFDFRGAQHRQVLSADLMKRVHAVAGEAGHTAFSALLAVYAELCSRHSDQRDLVIGMPLANRPPGFEQTVGMMINAAPLRLSIDPGTPFSEVAAYAMGRVFDAIDHQSAPIQDIVRALGRSSRGLGNPLFNTLFGLMDAPPPEMDVPGLSMDMQVALSAESSKFDLSVIVLPRRSAGIDNDSVEYELVWEYSDQLFDAGDVEQLADGFEAILQASVARPTSPIGSLAADATAPRVVDHETSSQSVDRAEPVAEAREWRGVDDGRPLDSLWLRAFRDVLQRNDIGGDTDFFGAGGYSLLVPQLLSHYESLSGWRPPIRMLFEYSSPAELEIATAARRPADIRDEVQGR